ncbi:MAG TPA: PsbP-related protein [Patescibacteria group bacterium]|nr:PsbP-related protein [Patescibacteria group bacterium]
MEANKNTQTDPTLPAQSDPLQSINPVAPNKYLRIFIIFLCFFVGIPLILIPIIIAIFVVPQLMSLYSHLEIHNKPSYFLIYSELFIAAALGGLNPFFGIKLIKHPTNLKKAATIAILTFFIQGVVLALSLIPILTPIYSLVNQIQDEPTKENTSVNQIKPLKTYTNTEYNYSLSYPSNLNIIPHDSTASNTFSLTNKPNPKNDLYPVDEDKKYFEIEVMVSPADGQSINDIATRMDNYKNRSDYVRTPYKLDGINGYKGTDISVDSYTMGVEVIKDNYDYFIALRKFDDKNTEGINDFNRILSLFKFTNLTDEHLWKTYSNDAYGFSLQYPSNLKIDPPVSSGTLVPPFNGKSPEFNKTFIDTDTYHYTSDDFIQNIDTGYRYNGFVIFISDNPDNEDFYTFAKNNATSIASAVQPYTHKTYTINVTKTEIGGREAYYYSGFEPLIFNFYMVRLTDSKFLILTNVEEANGQFTQQFQKILSTIKFTN